jgi:hypothetical protein
MGRTCSTLLSFDFTEKRKDIKKNMTFLFV